MNILHVATGSYPVPPRKSGAVQKIIFHLTRCLAELGHTLHIVDIKAPPDGRGDTPVRFHEVWVAPVSNSGPVRYLRRLSFAFASMLMVNRLIGQEKIDLVHMHNQFSGLAILVMIKLKHKVPTVYTSHIPDLFMWPTRWNRLKYIMEVTLLKQADHVIVQTPWAKDVLIRHLGLEPSRVTPVFSAVEVEDINHFITDYAEPVGEDNFDIILCAGSITPVKNQLTLIRAIPEVLQACPDTKFVFAGMILDKHYFAKLEKLVGDNNLNERVEFRGDLSKENLFGLYRQASLLVFPTLAETQGLVVTEAMAFDLPVIASNIGPISDIAELNDRSMLLINPLDPNALAGAIINLLQNPERRQEMAREARQLVISRFTWQKVAEETMLVYQRLTGRK